MKKNALVLILLIIFSICIFANDDIVNFVFKNYDFFIRFSNLSRYYNEIKNVQFFNFVLENRGLAFEDNFERILEGVKYSTNLNPDIITDSISQDILFASKNLNINFLDFFSFDLNYYFELIKNISDSAYIVFRTTHRERFVRYISVLLGLDMRSVGRNLYILGNGLHVSVLDNYVVIAGSKQALDVAVSTYGSKELQLTNQEKVVNRILNTRYIISGYAKGNVLNPDIIGSGIKPVQSEHTIFYSTVSEGIFSLTFEQRVTKVTKSKNLRDNLGNMPNAWNYYISVDARETETVLELSKNWIKGFQMEISKILDFLNYSSTNSSFFYLCGRIDSNEFVFVFDSFNGKNLEAYLNSISIPYDNATQTWRISNKNSTLYIFKNLNQLVVSTYPKRTYESFVRTYKRLSDVPFFYYIDRVTNFDLKTYIDIGDIALRTTGFRINSKLLFWKSSSGTTIFYRLLLS